MRVIKRTGEQESVSFDKVLARISNLSDGLNVNVYEIAQKVCSRIYDLVKTSELDELSAQMCSSMIVDHPDYGVLASRIIISNHHKNTSPSFSETINILYENQDDEGNNNPLISKDLFDVVQKNKEKLNSYIDYQRDYSFDYFGFKTLERSYLLKVNGKIVERPQHMLMRVALGIHGWDFKDALETYDYMSKKYFIHATPTLFNAGTTCAQLSSCYLLSMNGDSVDAIFESLKECALISKHSGGIGLHIHNIRAKGSRIRGTNGTSDGILPMLKVFNHTGRYINQSGKRNGSIAIYLEPWHADVESFLDMKKNQGNEEERARDLFYALWIPDLFMERVKEGKMWSLMCPDRCPGLSDVYGDEFNTLYQKYEAEGKFTKQVKAQDIWFKILESQIETGVPYLLFKDACNKKSNQKNLGTIRSSNLCTEIIEYSSPDEIAVCNLASICLPTYICYSENGEPYFDFEKLHQVTMIITKNLNKVIDINFYPHPKAKKSNLRHRPIGIGIQGLADLLVLMRMPFESKEAKDLNLLIFETMYHAALTQSMNISKKRHEYFLESTSSDTTDTRQQQIQAYLKTTEFDPKPDSKYPGAYSSFDGCPASQGILQYDMWNMKPTPGRYDWDSLKEDIKKYGIRNSLLLAPMPTASTSQIMSFNECLEPFTSNLYKRKTLAGEFILVNKYLIKDLIDRNLWNKDMKTTIMLSEGSIAHISEIPKDLRELYKTVWEISQKTLIDMAADRGAFICQSQSLNLFMDGDKAHFKALTSMYFYAHAKGLKTGVYYLRTKPKAKVQQFTIDPSLKMLSNVGNKKKPPKECVPDPETGACLMCSS